MNTYLNIADVTFGVSSETFSVLADNTNPAYREFEKDLSALTGRREVNITVHIKDSSPIALEGWRFIFSSGETWSLYAQGDRYRFLFPLAGSHQPVYQAETNSDFSEVTINFNAPDSGVLSSGEFFHPVRYPLDHILLMHYMGTRNGLILHSAGMIANNKGYIFPGASGAGKSTISTCLLDSRCLNLLSDDRMIVRFAQKKFSAHGTPWHGDAKIAKNQHAPLAGFFFLNKGPENRVEPLTERQAFEKLMLVASIPWYNKEIVARSFDFCERLVQNIPAYNLFFTPSSDLDQYLYNVIN